MFDLIYHENPTDVVESQIAIRKVFPHARFEDASDDVHPHRYGVTLPDEQREAYIKHAMREGFALCSLHIHLGLRIDQKEMDRLFNEVKAEEAEKEQTP
jgi:hypothetical protein